MLQLFPLLRLLPVLPLAAARQLTASASASSSGLLVAALVLLVLLGVLYYDRRNNFRWVTAGRHCVGECVFRLRLYRKRSGEKSMRVETE